MSAYINTITGQYPLFEGDIRLGDFNIGEVFVLPEGYALVTITDPPLHTKNQYAIEDMPVKINEQWFSTWTVIDLTLEQIAERDRPSIEVGQPLPIPQPEPEP
jgi:hypothetical protein